MIYMKQRSLLKWELAGIGVIFLLGSLFHFVFELTGSHAAAGAFFPVNESVFEHLKLTFWPSIIWWAFTYRFVKTGARNYMFSRAAALLVMPAVILIVYYAYTSITGWENVFVDIFIFLLAAAAGQMVGYWLMTKPPLPLWLAWLSVILIIVLGAGYVFFTFYPPYLSIFMDGNTHSYGIPPV
jgi:hypothetical protein